MPARIPPRLVIPTYLKPPNDYNIALHATLNMSSISALQARLKELSTSLAQIHPLVSRLRNFTTAIHSLLKEAEIQLEVLRVDVEALETATEGRRKGVDNEKELERERVVALAGRLAEDLKK
ncbi:syntaxin [Aspergillus oryzae 100-8]|nr:syntaxin [Aspergillus oryzae 100-8]